MAVNLLRVYNSGLNYGQLSIQNGGSLTNETGNESTCNLAASRKRQRDGQEYSFTRQYASIPAMEPQHNSSTPPVATPQTGATIMRRVKLAIDDNRLNTTMASTSGRSSTGCTLPMILDMDLQEQMLRQSEEIDQLIKFQGERMRQALEERRRRHTKELIAAIETGVLKQLKEKEVELERANRRMVELEEHVKELNVESQLWQNMANNNEVIAFNLRSSLEQVVAQSKEHSKEGCGESEVDDTASCHHGDTCDAHVNTLMENKELKEQRICRVCKANSVCILLLPCRHLCLCRNCEGKVEVCPLCRSTKNASVQVYMS